MSNAPFFQSEEAFSIKISYLNFYIFEILCDKGLVYVKHFATTPQDGGGGRYYVRQSA